MLDIQEIPVAQTHHGIRWTSTEGTDQLEAGIVQQGLANREFGLQLPTSLGFATFRTKYMRTSIIPT